MESDCMFNVTDEALNELATALKETQEKAPDQELYVRISMGVGWGGPQLQLALEGQALPNDEVIEFKDGVRLLISERDKFYLEGKKLDFKQQMFGQGGFALVSA